MHNAFLAYALKSDVVRKKKIMIDGGLVSLSSRRSRPLSLTRLSTLQVADRVIAAQNSNGFQLARFSHCESRLMGFEDFFPRNEIDRSLRLQLGDDTYTDAQVRSISSGIKKAYNSCDIVGVTNLQASRPEQGELDELLLKIPTMTEFFGLNNGQKFSCSSDIHLDLLLADELNRIIRNFDSLCLISCRNISDSFSVAYNRNARQILIPQEHRTSGLDTDHVRSKHFPDYFHVVIEQIEKTVENKMLVLIGAGFLGKIYGTKVKELGGVALDVGSVFDVWAGVESRGFFDSGHFGRYRLGACDEAKKVVSVKPLIPSRRDWVVADADRTASWTASANCGTGSVKPVNKPSQIALKGSEIFIHSTQQGSNIVEFSGIDLGRPIFAIAATLLLPNRLASNTVFRFEVTAHDGKKQIFEEVCSGDTSFHWMGLLPHYFEVESISITTLPIEGGKTNYGWSYVRALRAY